MGGPTMHPQHVQPGPPLSWISPAAPPASGCVTASVLTTRSSLFLELITALMIPYLFLLMGEKVLFVGEKKAAQGTSAERGFDARCPGRTQPPA